MKFIKKGENSNITLLFNNNMLMLLVILAMRKSVSICMATYNGEKYIKNQISSILNQMEINDELIISDDNSTDSTISIIKSFNDSRIKLLDKKERLGCSLNFELAIKNAINDIILLSDQDDVWMDNKIEIMVSDLEKYDLVMSNAYITDSDLRIIHDSLFEKLKVKKGFLSNLLKTRYVGACMGFTKEVKDKILPFPRNSKFCQHDYWITLIAELYFTTKLDNHQLIYYRRHSNNLSSGGDSNINNRSLLLKIATRLYTLYHIFLRVVFKK